MTAQAPRSSNLRALLATTKRETRLLGAVERHLLSVPSDRDTTVLHPSEIISADFCPLAAYHQLSGTRPSSRPSSPNLRLQNIFDAGHRIHATWQSRLRDMGVLYGWWYCLSCRRSWWAKSPTGCRSCGVGKELVVFKEVPVESRRHRMRGHADGWVKGLGDDFLLEIKSVGPGTIRKYAPALMSEGSGAVAFRQVNRPFPDHYAQVNLYMHLVNESAHLPGAPEGFGEVHEAVVLYEYKESQDVKEFVVRYDPDDAREYMRIASHVVSQVNDADPPACPHGGCSRCAPFRDNR